jgi:hypothetical protein
MWKESMVQRDFDRRLTDKIMQINHSVDPHFVPNAKHKSFFI